VPHIVRFPRQKVAYVPHIVSYPRLLISPGKNYVPHIVRFPRQKVAYVPHIVSPLFDPGVVVFPPVRTRQRSIVGYMLFPLFETGNTCLYAAVFEVGVRRFSSKYENSFHPK
jgi:hypothetical protein